MMYDNLSMDDLFSMYSDLEDLHTKNKLSKNFINSLEKDYYVKIKEEIFEGSDDFIFYNEIVKSCPMLWSKNIGGISISPMIACGMNSEIVYAITKHILRHSGYSSEGNDNYTLCLATHLSGTAEKDCSVLKKCVPYWNTPYSWDRIAEDISKELATTLAEVLIPAKSRVGAAIYLIADAGNGKCKSHFEIGVPNDVRNIDISKVLNPILDEINDIVIKDIYIIIPTEVSYNCLSGEETDKRWWGSYSSRKYSDGESSVTICFYKDYVTRG